MAIIPIHITERDDQRGCCQRKSHPLSSPPTTTPLTWNEINIVRQAHHQRPSQQPPPHHRPRHSPRRLPSPLHPIRNLPLNPHPQHPHPNHDRILNPDCHRRMPFMEVTPGERIWRVIWVLYRESQSPSPHPQYTYPPILIRMVNDDGWNRSAPS